MNRDPFYQEIIAGLNGALNPNTFEDCAADLLQGLYPGLAPIPGGRDAGMDGAIPDEEGEPFPLVATTQEDVIGNLTKNLSSYLGEGRRRRKVVVATSRSLTPRRVQNLFDRAEEMGFTLVNVHQQQDIALRLYRSPEWCRELLGLTGRPAALSIFPRSTRPLVNSELIGREKSIKWLHETTDDRLLVGQPGSGKTYLLQKFALEDGGLFIVDTDREALAGAIRSIQPRSIIVDDAQIKTDNLENLVQLRNELGADFSIVMSCWPSDQGLLAHLMNLAVEKVEFLALLTRDEIVSVIKDTGILGPVELIGEIVNQSDGKPGLAATLSHMCLQGRTREVFLGNQLNQSVRDYFLPRLGEEAIFVLAAIALGGEAGISLRAVADGLEMRPVAIRQVAIHLGTAGILWEIDEDILCVFPETLRFTLVRDVFFQGAYSLPLDNFLNLINDPGETAQVLIGARARGAGADDEILRSLLVRTGNPRVWEHYAWLGEEEALWVLESYPDFMPFVIHPALEYVPQVILPRLFQEAVGDSRPIHNATDHPLRRIDDWVKSAWPGSGKAIPRRKTLQEQVINWLNSGGDVQTGLRVLRTLFSPECGDVQTDPGSGNQVTLRRAYLLPEEMRGLQELWQEVPKALRNVEVSNWKPLQDLIFSWISSYGKPEIPDDWREIKNGFGKRIFEDVLTLFEGHPGLLLWAKKVSDDYGFEYEFHIDTDYEVLYQNLDREDWRAAEEEQLFRVQELAEAWKTRTPQEVADRMTWLRQEALLAGESWQRWPEILCAQISESVENPEIWARAFIEAALDGAVIFPFVKQSVLDRRPSWEKLLLDCLTSAALKGVAISIAVTMNEPPLKILDQSLADLTRFRGMIKTYCLRGEVPVETLRRLFTHPDIEVASAAALGEWFAEPKGTVREQVLGEWRQAAIRSRETHFLREIFSTFPEMAFEWFVMLIENDFNYGTYESTIGPAAAGLSREDKEKLLHRIPQNWTFGGMVSALISTDPEMYRILLSIEDLQMFHQVPLGWHPGKDWEVKLAYALDKFSPEEIAGAAFGDYPLRITMWSGKRSLKFQQWVERFEALSTSENAEIQRIGEIGKSLAENKLRSLLREEHDEEVFGWRGRPGRRGHHR